MWIVKLNNRRPSKRGIENSICGQSVGSRKSEKEWKRRVEGTDKDVLANRITSMGPEWDDSKHRGGGSKSGQENISIHKP